MQIKHNAQLKDHSTMRLGGQAKHLVNVTDKHELTEAVAWAKKNDVKFIVIGGGSNIIWSDKGFDGLVIVNQIKGFKVEPEDNEYSYVTVGAGEDWDKTVQRTVEAGLHGIEALSLIPGTAGATPVQNVGAYGQEVAKTLVSLEVLDMHNNSFITLANEDCEFGYRSSRFKKQDKGRFLIVGLTFRLRRINPRPPYYPAVAKYFRENRINLVTPKVLRDAVVAIRTQKLPDPKKVANNGSFFANPIISKAFFNSFKKDFTDAPHWKMPDGKVKLSAAWLIEQAGFKNFQDKKTGMATWKNQPLVLVNEKAKTTKDLVDFRNKIIAAVEEKFGVQLEQEPELIT